MDDRPSARGLLAAGMAASRSRSLSSTAAAFLSPVVAVGLGAFVFHEPLASTAAAGALLILSAGLLVSWPRSAGPSVG